MKWIDRHSEDSQLAMPQGLIICTSRKITWLQLGKVEHANIVFLAILVVVNIIFINGKFVIML